MTAPPAPERNAGTAAAGVAETGGPPGVLVTGGTGFVGAAVVRHLLAEGRPVWTTRAGSSAAAEPGTGASVTWDATVGGLPDVPWDRIGSIIHLAAPRELKAPTDDGREMFEVLVSATFRLWRAAREHGTARFILASTGDVLPDGDAPLPATRGSYRPRSPYAAFKAAAEAMLDGLDPPPAVTVLRLFHPYGPGGDRFLINRLAAMVATGRTIEIQAPDGITLNPVWIEDAAEAFRLATAANAGHGVFHVAGPDVVRLRPLLERMGSLCGRPPRIAAVARTDSANHAGDWTTSASDLGYRPHVGLQEGLAWLMNRTS